MGGGSAGLVPFANGGNPIEMPNFLHFLPMPGYPGETANGIRQIAGGFDSGGTFGAPVSLGASVSAGSRRSSPGGGRRHRRSSSCISSRTVTASLASRPLARPAGSRPQDRRKSKLQQPRRGRHLAPFRAVQKQARAVPLFSFRFNLAVLITRAQAVDRHPNIGCPDGTIPMT